MPKAIKCACFPRGYDRFCCHLHVLLLILAKDLIEKNKNQEALKLLIKWHNLVFKVIFFACMYIFMNAENLILLTYGNELHEQNW